MGASAIFAIIMGVMAAVAGIGSIISQSVANEKNRELNEANREDQQSFSQIEAEKANERTENLYGKLYSPEAKVTQMRNAGLSPGLMYGMGGAGGTSSTQGAQASTPSVAAPVMNPIISKDIMGTLLNAMGNMAEIKETESNVRKIDKEIDLIEEQTKTQVISQNGIELENKLKEIDLQYKGDTMQSTIDKLKAETEAIENNMRKTLKEIDLLEIDKKYKPQLYDIQLKKTAQDILESKSRQMLNMEEIELTKAKTDKERAEIRKVVAETTKLIEETKITEIEVDMAKIERVFKAAKEQVEITNKMGSGNIVTGTIKLFGESIGYIVDMLTGAHDHKKY